MSSRAEDDGESLPESGEVLWRMLPLIVDKERASRSKPQIESPGALDDRIIQAKHAIRPVSGFTLLELLVVMVIIGLLAGYVAPKFFSQVDKSEVKTAQAQIVAFDKAIAHYRLDIGRFPASEQGLEALVARPANETKWDGPYLDKRVPLDPWGNPYLYKFPGEHRDYDLLSLGKDGRPGGEGSNADVTNW